MDEGTKRKRISDPEGQPDAKRTAPLETPSSRDPRTALAELYAAYDALHRNQYANDDDLKAGEAHFAVLLSAVQGDGAVQSLAIRLLSKFAPRFPSLISDAAMALQGLSSLNLNNNTTSSEDLNKTAPIESLLGLKRMLLAVTTAASNNSNSNAIAAAAQGALHFSLQQLAFDSDIMEEKEEQRFLYNSIAKAAFIACPRVLLPDLVDLATDNNTAAAGKNEKLGDVALQFVQEHLLATVQEQEADIKEAILASDSMTLEEEEKETETSQMSILLAVLKKTAAAGGSGSGGGGGDADDLRWAVSSLQSLFKHAHRFSTSARLVDGLKSVIETLSPRRPSPLGAGAGAAGSKRRRSSGSLSPKPTSTNPTTTRGGRSSYGGGSKDAVAPLPSFRPPRSSPPFAGGRREREEERERGAGRKSNWSSRGPTPTLEEGELGELDEGELLPSSQPPSSSQKQKQEQLAARRSRSPGRDERYRDRDRERDRDRDTGRRGRGSPSPYPSSSAYRNRGGGDRDGDRGGEYRDRGGPPPSSSLPHSSSQRDMRGKGGPLPTTKRGMPPLEYAGKALWVGQVPLGPAAEREMVDAFAQFGPLTSHKIIARSSCAFINYVDIECAIEAREKLDGARVAGSTLVVEFKGEKKYWDSRERDSQRDSQRDFRDREYRGSDRGERDYRSERDRDYRGDREEYTHTRPFIGGPPPQTRRDRASRSRSRSPGGRRRRSLDGEGGGGGWQGQGGRLYSMMSEQLPSISALPTGAPTTAPPPAAGAVHWRGSLGKSRQKQAEVACLDHFNSFGVSPPSSGWAAAEPAGWPAMLDVQNRISTAYVLTTLLPMLPPAERAALRIVPNDPSEAARLHAFSSYLQGKQRTGVVDLGAGPQSGAPRQRVLYLIPPSPEACRALGFSTSQGMGAGESMFAVVAAKIDE